MDDETEEDQTEREAEQTDLKHEEAAATQCSLIRGC